MVMQGPLDGGVETPLIPSHRPWVQVGSDELKAVIKCAAAMLCRRSLRTSCTNDREPTSYSYRGCCGFDLALDRWLVHHLVDSPLVLAWELVTTELGDAEAGWRRCSLSVR